MASSPDVGGVQFDFEDPEGPESCRERIRDLQDAIETIQYQLADPNKTDKHGERLPDEKYQKWRRQALKALTAKKQELRYLKDWLRAYQHEATALRLDVDPNSCEDLLKIANNLIQQKKNEGVSFSPIEYKMADLVRDYVLGIPPDRSAPKDN